MHILNIQERDTQEQTEPLFDYYRDSLKDVIDNNIDNVVSSRNNLLQLSKPSIPALQLKRAIPLLFGFFSNDTRATSSKANNSSKFSLNNSLPKLPPSIVLNNLSNLLSKSDNCRLQKIKKRAILTSKGLGDSSYGAG